MAGSSRNIYPCPWGTAALYDHWACMFVHMPSKFFCRTEKSHSHRMSNTPDASQAYGHISMVYVFLPGLGENSTDREQKIISVEPSIFMCVVETGEHTVLLL